MNYSDILFELREGVATITLNRPDNLNALTEPMHGELQHALGVTEAQGARVLVLTGAGRGFCAGQDLNEGRAEQGSPPKDLGQTVERFYNPLVRRLVGLKVPVLCAVNGVAAGAGANIALACDIVVARESAKFIQAFVNIGLMPDAGGTWVVPRLIGQARAMGWMMAGTPLSATQAAEWGLIWRAVPDGEFAAEVQALAKRLAEGPTLAFGEIKQALWSGWTSTLDAQADHERDRQRTLGFSDDYAEGVTAFIEKRSPNYRGA